jgi:hypothetical protein
MISCGANIAKDGIRRQPKALKVELLTHIASENIHEKRLSPFDGNADCSIFADRMGAFRGRANGTKMEVERS